MSALRFSAGLFNIRSSQPNGTTDTNKITIYREFPTPDLETELQTFQTNLHSLPDGVVIEYTPRQEWSSALLEGTRQESLPFVKINLPAQLVKSGSSYLDSTWIPQQPEENTADFLTRVFKTLQQVLWTPEQN